MKRVFAVFICSFLAASSAQAADNAFKGRAGIYFGRDNNTKLNADRKGDFFNQEALSLDYAPRLSDALKLRLSGDVMNAHYYEATDLNIILIRPGAGLDLAINPYTTLQADYTYEIFYFPNLDTGTSDEHEERLGLVHKLNKMLTFRWGASLFQKGFEHRTLRQATGVVSMTEREDSGIGADAALTYKISKKQAIKAGFNYFLNDSNDQFHDYYDYDYWKGSLSYIAEICPKVTGYFAFSYTNRFYKTRPLRDDISVEEEDETYTSSATLSYRLDKNTSLSAAYSYRENHSNEPSRKYSGSLVTLGLAYSF